MKILYISCHAILEYDEVKLLTELGHDVFSVGAYSDPKGHPTLPRPGIEGMKHRPFYQKLASSVVSKGYDIPQPLINWADTIIFMHMDTALRKNLHKMKGKRVIYRSIGQTTPANEQLLAGLRKDGVELLRYSIMESNIPDYAGADNCIYFYKDPDEFHHWHGSTRAALNITQSFIERTEHTRSTHIMLAAATIPLHVYGIGNEEKQIDSTTISGEIDYQDLLVALSSYRAYIYGGTWPAPYTLSFIEAMMAGIPILALTGAIANQLNGTTHFRTYEPDLFIHNGVNGFIGSPIELNEKLRLLMHDKELAHEIGQEGREYAIDTFGKEVIAQKWREYLG